MSEAERKRELAREAAARTGRHALVTSSPPTVRWLLCGRGRPVDAAAPSSPYTVVLRNGSGYVLFADIEAPRVAAEERFDELGYESVPYPWHAGPERLVAELLEGTPAIANGSLEGLLAPQRRTLCEPELERYRRAGADTAAATAAAVARLDPAASERDAAAELACQAQARGLFPVVVLAAGEERQPVHRHPLPTGAVLGRHALLALTAERDGLYVSVTRLVSFAAPPARLAELVRSAATVDAAMLDASRPGEEVGSVFAVAASAYAAEGFPEEWRFHHQGGMTGYRGREVFAVPGDRTPIPECCAVAWNPSITGGAKSEDTALVSRDGIEVITRTPSLPELDVGGRRRPGIAIL